VNVFLTVAALLVLLPAMARAQDGQIAGSVRDSSDALIPGVTIEVASPALIEKIRTAITDSNGQYRLTNLPVGTYKLTFSLAGFTKSERDGIEVTTNNTSPVNGVLTVGQVTETVIVSGATPVVDVQNAREVINISGDAIKELPTGRNVTSLLNLTAGIQSPYRPGSGAFSPGVCVGGIGVFCNPGVAGFNVGDAGTAFDSSNMAQGRVLVDGQVINAGAAVPIVGQTGGYTADIANAAEVNIVVSGALGESETGGSSINIVPRTGGNRYAGDFNTTYTTAKWFFANNDEYPTLNILQPIKSDHDVSLAFGGPIKRDKLWFYTVGRDQGIDKVPGPSGFYWPNLNEGKAGFNYIPDRSKPTVGYQNLWRNANMRVTYQMSAKNKFNFFWDEQDFCQDPCHGVVSVFTSPESWFSPAAYPNRLKQASWTNPLTSKILLEAGISVTSQVYSTASSRDYTNPVNIPRITETGTTVGLDNVASQVNIWAGGAPSPFAGVPGGFANTSGSLNTRIGEAAAEIRDTANYRSRASISYVTGSHHAKLGYDGGYYTQLERNQANLSGLTYNYFEPAATANCNIAGTCGNMSLQFPTDPNNLARRPFPQNVMFNTGTATLDDRVKYVAFYAQDQWTLKRITASLALRYDHATSSYGQTVFPASLPTMQYSLPGFTVPASNGVNYNDITPRVGVTWDVRGNGKTSVKVNWGRYLNAAGISGVYSGANPARRTVNILSRVWNDTNGNRKVDCDLLNTAANGECLGFNTIVDAFFTPGNDTTRFGKDPLSLDASGIPIGLATTQCGRTEQGIPANVQAYCNAYGKSVLDGWGNRRKETQFGIALQHELLPRLSAEVTYNHRWYSNILVSDQLGLGCDQFNGATTLQACDDALLKYSSPSYDFYTVTAPTDPNLPGGGGYKILGLNDVKTAVPFGLNTAQTYLDALSYTFKGVDTNFSWRGPRGIRIQGGTSTGATQRESCAATVDQPNVRGRTGAEYLAGCKTQQPYLTTVKGSASYTVPKIDVLVATVFQSLPGPEITALMTYNKSDITWNPDSAARATRVCATATNGVGCLGGAANNTTTTGVQLLLNNELYGKRVNEWDVKLAKNIRFAGKRLQIGIDAYNFFNSDVPTGYNATYTPGPANTWMQPTTLLAPRFIRAQVQLSF
jgi:hypothetical protein